MNPLSKHTPVTPAQASSCSLEPDLQLAAEYRNGASISGKTDLIDALCVDRPFEPGLGDDDEIYRVAVDDLVLVRTFTGAGDYTYSIEPYAGYLRAWENVREDEAESERIAYDEDRHWVGV